MLNFVCHGVMVPNYDYCGWVEVWAGFGCIYFFWYRASCASATLSKHRTPSDR